MRPLGGLERLVCAELVRRDGTPVVARPGGRARARRMPGLWSRSSAVLVSVLEQGCRNYEGGERGAAVARGDSAARVGRERR